MRDLVATVVCCNCAISIVILFLTLQTIKLRQQLVTIANWCVRWEREWDLLMSIDCQGSIETSERKIGSLRQLYQQQLATLDRLRSLLSVLRVARTILKRRARIGRG